VRDTELVEKVAAIKGTACQACGRPLCGHEAVVAVVMGFGGSPRCLPCLAAPLGSPTPSLLDDVHAHVVRRDCYLAGWRWAAANEPDGCEWGNPAQATPDDGDEPDRAPPPATAGEPSATSWDAGTIGCGELVLELRERLAPLSAGVLFELVARDPGAREDIPAWCTMTRHTLVQARHPAYVIRVRTAAE
jgi:tRNA 2-thiouridine synthesizing protein A